MTSDEIKKITDENYRAWEPNNPNMSTEVAIMQAVWETAYQLAVLNENNTRANVQITGDNRLLVRMDEGGVMADTKQAPTVPDMTNEMLEVIIDNMTNRYICSQGEARSMARELAQLRARVAILDAQEVKLPDWEPNKDAADEWWERIKDHEGGSVGAKAWYQCALSRERQLLDAQRAVQAWREASSTYRTEHRRAAENNFRRDCGCRRCKGYDALAGKGE